MLQNPELHYLDNAATTMVASEVADVIDKAMREHWANPSSLYGPGARSEEALNAARAAVARTLGCKPKELYFTSCGSESNNLALLGAVRTRTFGKGIVVSGFEHPSVQRPLEELAKQGYNVTVVKPRPDGTLDINEMLEHVDKNTILVACMMVNNEVGTRNDVERLAAEVKRRNSRTIVHVDAVQAWMRVPIKLTNIDTLSVSGHKIHAPKGIGALYLSDRLVQAFRPPYLGGEQERGLRPGTENLPYAMGLAAAATRLAKTMKSRDTAMKALNQRLRDGLKAFPGGGAQLAGRSRCRVLNFSEMCIKSETMRLAWLARGAARYMFPRQVPAAAWPSHTLAAMGKDPRAIDTASACPSAATTPGMWMLSSTLEDGDRNLQRIRSETPSVTATPCQLPGGQLWNIADSFSVMPRPHLRGRLPRPEDVTEVTGCFLKSYRLQILLSGDTTFMHEIIMGYQGEMSLKGLNRNQFESAMMKILRYRLKTVGKFKVYCTQSTFYMEPEEENVDMDLAFDRVSKVFGLAALSRAVVCDKDFDTICQTAEDYLGASLHGIRTFKVEARRSDKTYPMTSPELMRELGAYLLGKHNYLKVDVHNPILGDRRNS